MKKVLVAVAHPDDETLWCGGTLLVNSGWDKTVFALTRKSDPDRAPRFSRACRELGARGLIADLDDGPEQKPLAYDQYKNAFIENLKVRDFDIVITHAPFGEYTRHLRHEELSQALSFMLFEGVLSSREVWFFWYSDEGGRELPSARNDCDLVISLDDEGFLRKSSLLFDIYGFSRESWEGRALPRDEGFKIRKDLLKG
ncbi:MAG TPA: PIG-L family deacetylase [Acidobacteriota bacterium]|jgi:hypothetical protein|nr:PIG-L family deacetylase [Acidobacteriota bacterium]HNT16650.1 PIG-L family deacetylase [Acidobacteriota bacterium]